MRRPIGCAVVGCVALLLAGCGTNPTGTLPGSTTPRVDVPSNNAEGTFTKLVVLDWTGGYAESLAQDLTGADLSQLYLTSGEGADTVAEAFEEAVRARVEEILAALEPAEFVVVTDEGDAHPGATVVYFTGDAVAGERYQVGQTKLDQCDLREEATVIVWLGTMLKLGDEHAFDQWINALANTAAHEIGHTVGFFHPDAESVDFTAYEKNVEIMMGVHTLSALLSRQEFIIPQDTCPASVERQYGGVAYELSSAPGVKATDAAERAAEPVVSDFISE